MRQKAPSPPAGLQTVDGKKAPPPQHGLNAELGQVNTNVPRGSVSGGRPCPLITFQSPFPRQHSFTVPRMLNVF